ncbi:hypothetical protein ILUMI_20258 [Ignelater luminosus]|uniref:HTH psq-type domain-containing protein n=1 Tax=Ignelater luminosus TaxID=2038154 RepID=A0A8K0FZ36_IGNLU|nr:hypothetical protein ILUMI_20258 [Ignelater luminosus]
MPKTKEPSLYRKTYTEANITHALDAINHGMSKRKSAAVFNIPRSTLQFCLSENFVKSKHGPNPVLSVAEENTLVDWILNQTQEMKDKTDDNENSQEHESYDYLRNICDLDLTENSPENLQKGNVATYNIEDIPIVIVSPNVQLNDFCYNDSLTAQNLQILSDCEEIENISLNVELNYSNKNKLIADYGNISSECKSNSNKKTGILHEYLIWPETPHRTGTRNRSKKDQMPYVITSSGWENLFNEQQEIKENAELEKLERKQKRIENKENKLLTQKEKKPRKGISTVNVISNAILPITENSFRSEKTQQPENHVRRLFEDDSNTSSVVTQKSETNGTLQSLSSSCFVNSGLCYMCVKNITSVNVGLKCKVCRIRQYGDMVFVCGFCNENATAAVEEYR